jgi:protein CMS1
VRKFQKKGSPVAKLVSKDVLVPDVLVTIVLTGCDQFAKHFKVEEQVSFLQKTRTGIAVGTPQRLIDLIENGNCPPPPSGGTVLTPTGCR